MRVCISPNAEGQKHLHEVQVDAVLMRSSRGVDEYIRALQTIRDLLWNQEKEDEKE